MRGLSSNPSQHHSFLGVYHICSTWSKAKAAIAKRICHHDTDAGTNFEWSQDEVETCMHKTIPKNTTSLFILVEKFWYAKKSEENKSIMRRFDTKIGHDVSKTDE